MVSSARSDMYEFLASQANIAEAGGLAKEKAILLLWFLRNVVGIEELEAYDNVCDGDNDQGIDGLFLERGGGEDEPDTLVIYQSKYGDTAAAEVGATDIDRLAGAAHFFTDSNTLKDLLDARIEPSLRQLIDSLELVKLLADPNKVLEVRLVLVTAGLLKADAKRKVNNLRASSGEHYIDVWDIDRLGPLALVVRSPERIPGAIKVDFDESEILVTGDAPNRVAVLPVRAIDVTTWPGIESRQLFALNVRHELQSNRVSKALDGAIKRPSEHANFLAYHNGLTIVCESFESNKGVLTILRPSVVNGAQSVLAFQRGAKDGHLTDDLRVFMKVVEVEGMPSLEKEVGRRSNTQTGVNPRNLMANHGVQLRLEREFQTDYTDIVYETRPDVLETAGKQVIKNDEAAQLLCAIFNEWPELAVKKNSLFEPENHPQIFSERIRAHHILFAERIKNAVQARKGDFPDLYQESWLLTRITACYLVGQELRESGVIADLTTASRTQLEEPALLDILDDLAFAAAMTMSERNRLHGDADDYKRDFKNEQKLHVLGAAARTTYRLMEKLNEDRGQS